MCFPLAIGVAVGAGIAAAEAAGATTATVGAVITAAIEGGIIAGVEGEALLIAGMGLQCLLGPVGGGIATEILGVAASVGGVAIGGLGGDAEGTFETSTYDASGKMLGAPIQHAPSSLAAMSGEFSQATAEHLLGSMLDLGGDNLPSQLGALAPDGSLAGTIPSQSSQYLAMGPGVPTDQMADVQGAMSEQSVAEQPPPGTIMGKAARLADGDIEVPIQVRGQVPDSGITTIGGVAQGRTPPGVLALGDDGGLSARAASAPALTQAPGGAVSHLIEASAGPAPNALGASPAAAAAAGAVITAQLQALGVPLPTAAGRGVVAPRLPRRVRRPGPLSTCVARRPTSSCSQPTTRFLPSPRSHSFIRSRWMPTVESICRSSECRGQLPLPLHQRTRERARRRCRRRQARRPRSRPKELSPTRRDSATPPC